MQLPEEFAHINLTEIQVRSSGLIQSNPAIFYDELIELTRKERTTVMRNISKLKKAGILRRIGSRKTGYWEVME
ncbi:hypothetical protein JXO59_10295 [candidate division KSB1 bacterium]|nr:hypothetical protein [candidate division KSB1 bacterium]